MRRIGFTGTQDGMSEAQKRRVEDWLFLNDWLHHGDCIGSDAQAHEIARRLGLKITGHPPLKQAKRAFCQCDVLWLPKDYIARNHDIVDATDELLATPAQMQEELRSGTWATVRYAKKQGKLVTIIYPDGAVEFLP